MRQEQQRNAMREAIKSEFAPGNYLESTSEYRNFDDDIVYNLDYTGTKFSKMEINDLTVDQALKGLDLVRELRNEV